MQAARAARRFMLRMLALAPCIAGPRTSSGSSISRRRRLRGLEPARRPKNPRKPPAETGGFLFMTHYRTDDVRIEQGDELLAPMQVMRELAATERSEETTFGARKAVHDILRGADDRLLVVVGPCSIHDYKAAVQSAGRNARERERLRADLAIVMRVYFEKPRTTVGWKGFINDPHLDETFDMNEGIRLARKLLLELNHLGVPCGTEFLDLISPQYIADLIAWGAIGA